jgi:Concanavalin A-like lectin/glucanases superfamily
VSLEVNYRPTRFRSLRADEWTSAPPGPTLTLDPALTGADGRRIFGRLLTGGAATVEVDWGDGTPYEALVAPYNFEHTYAVDAVYLLRAIATSAAGRTSVETARVQAMGTPTGGGGPGPGPEDAYRDLVLSHNPVAYYRLGVNAGGFGADECGGPPGAFGGTTTTPAMNLLRGGAAGASTQFGDGDLHVEGHPGLGFEGVWTIEVVLWTIDAIGRCICYSDTYLWGVTIIAPNSLHALREGGAAAVPLAPAIPLTSPVHFVYVEDEGHVTVYLNGVVAHDAPAEVEVEEFEGDQPHAPGSGRAGRRLDGGSPFGGLLQEWALYDHKLTAGEVRAHVAAAGLTPDPEEPG